MSRAKKSAQQRAEDEVARRRNSAANRALRRRAERGKGAHVAGVEPTVPQAAPTSSSDAQLIASIDDDQIPGDVVDDSASASSAHETVEPLVEDEPAPQESVPAGPGADETAVFAPITDEVLDSTASAQDVVDEPAYDEPVRHDSAPDESVRDEPALDESPVEQTVAFESVTDTTPLPPVAVTPAAPEPVAPAPAPAPAPAVAPEPEPEPVAPAPASAPEWSQPPAARTPLPAANPFPVVDETTPRTKRRKAWIIPFVVVGLAVLYVGVQALLSNTVPTSTETMGIAIGGMSATQAEGEIDNYATQLETADLELRAAEQVFALPAADAGLDIDAQATVAQVTGFTLAPDRLWAHVVGGGEIDAVATVDHGMLTDALESAAAHLDGPTQDAGVTVADGAVTVVPGRSAVTVDQAASAELVAESWPLSQSIDLVADTEEPAITDSDAQAFAGELETRTFAGPVTLVGDDAEAMVEPATIAENSTVVPGVNGLELDVDGEGLAAAILEANPDLTTDGDNASVSFDDKHQIVIDEGTPGITIDAERLGEAVTTAARSPDRTGELPYTAADPEVSADDLGLADYKERVVSFDTPITSERVRTQNLRAAAKDVTGTILHPGDSFDLVETLQPITEEKGYGAAGVIVNGILTKGMGGGLSQMATNTYNAAYFAGYEIVEHRPHSVWLPRYPAGRESTMYTGSINVVFTNNTPYSAVMNSYIDGGRLYVDIWSTEHFEVKTAASPKSNIRQPGVKEVTAANCEAKGPGQPGFTITNTRTVLLDGEEVDKTSDTWTYRPDDAIKCVSPDKEKSNNDD